MNKVSRETAEAMTCKECKGKKKVKWIQEFRSGTKRVYYDTCPHCQGTGQEPREGE